MENDGGSCNMLEPMGTPVVPTCVQGEPPVATGGTVDDGLYVLQGFVLYSSSCPTLDMTVRNTWAVCGTSWATAQEVTQADASAPQVTRYNMTQTVSGSTLTAALSCPVTGSNGWTFSASPGHLTLIRPYLNGVEQSLYVRQ
jgi:hypothetical protein